MTLRVLKSMEIFIKIKTTAKQQQQRKLISNGLYFQNLISMFSCIQGHLSFLRGDNYIISHRAFPWALCSPSGKQHLSPMLRTCWLLEIYIGKKHIVFNSKETILFLKCGHWLWINLRAWNKKLFPQQCSDLWAQRIYVCLQHWWRAHSCLKLPEGTITVYSVWH